MLFEVSGVEVAPWVPPLVSLGISLFCATAGVTGAFLLLPFQVSVLGYAAPSVSATNQLYNVVAIPGGVWRYIREGRMVWPLALAVVAGTLPGVFLGAIARIVWLPDARRFKLFAAAVLLYIGYRLVLDVWRGLRPGSRGKTAEERFSRAARSATEEGGAPPRTRTLRCDLRRIEYGFMGETFGASTPAVFLLSLLVGVAGGIYGIGGGAIIAPIFVSVFRLPVYTVAGAALMGTFVTSVAGVGFYTAISPFFPQHSLRPDWLLGLLFGLGGLVGVYLGARLQKYMPAAVIKLILCAVILITVAKYAADFIAG